MNTLVKGVVAAALIYGAYEMFGKNKTTSGTSAQNGRIVRDSIGNTWLENNGTKARIISYEAYLALLDRNENLTDVMLTEDQLAAIPDFGYVDNSGQFQTV